MLKPLRVCRECGLKAHTIEDLKRFGKAKTSKYGRRNLCHKCENKRQRKYNRQNIEKAPLKYTLFSLKGRARRKGVKFDLDIEHLRHLWSECGGKCPMTGVSMLKKSYVNNPLAMTVDRLDGKKGYIKGNVRLVSRWYNIARSNWGDRFVLEMCQKVIAIGNP